MENDNKGVESFTIYPPEGKRDYKVSIPNYHGGEVVRKEHNDLLKLENERLREALRALRTDDEINCWCDFGGMAPNDPDFHQRDCLAARAALAEKKGGVDEL